MLRPYEHRFPWNLDWNLLRTFLVVVEQRSVSRAADFLGLKQPTISAALKRLEDSVGQVLIERRPNRFRVTRAGEVLFSECSAIFGTVSQLPALMQAGAESLSGHVSLVMTSHVVSPHLDAVLAEVAQRHPNVTFSVVVAESGEVLKLVEQNRAAFGICLVNRQPRHLDAPVLCREFFALYCGAKHRLFEAPHIKLADLAGEPSVGFHTEVEGGPLQSVNRLRERARLAPGPRGVSANLPEVRRMIVANIGIGALPVHVAARDVGLGLLRQLPPHDRLPAIDIHLVTNPRRQMSAPEAALRTAFTDLIERESLSARTYGAPTAP